MTRTINLPAIVDEAVEAWKISQIPAAIKDHYNNTLELRESMRARKIPEREISLYTRWDIGQFAKALGAPSVEAMEAAIRRRELERAVDRVMRTGK